jgi:mRNA N6-methyladenine demethylase
VKGKKIGGMKVISMDKPKVKPAPAKKAKAAPIAAQQVDDVPAKLTKQQRRDRNKLAKTLAEQAASREQGVHMSLKQIQAKAAKAAAAVVAANNYDGYMDGSSASGGSDTKTKNAKDAPPQVKRVPAPPPTCPVELQLPKSDCDRFVIPADPTYEKVMQTCYSGCVLQEPEKFKPKFHTQFRQAMEGLEDESFYQFDLTQPMGLGTKVAKTYVTRCLVGKPGITYKYLGLRMFAYPWTAGEKGATKNTIQIGILNNTLAKHTKTLLAASGKKEFGACDFNLTLINRNYPDGSFIQLKDEPTFQKEKCTVSWHADSSLQHYSAIAVYHCTKPEGSSTSTSARINIADGEDVQEPEVDHSDDSWRIALRQFPNAEGPLASKLKTRQSTSEGTSASTAPPPVAIPLPNQYSYFLLDDFNHNNQHSVLAGNTDRYASTHRVGRLEGHTFDSIKSRTQAALRGGRGGASSKQIKSDLYLQAEVEFEWIRQFYVQGQAHYDRHIWWHEPMQVLLGLWGELEGRIRRHTQTLYDAGGQLQADQKELQSQSQDSSTPEYKQKRKQVKKRSERVGRIMSDIAAFDVLHDGLKERKEKRHGWRDREHDNAVKTMPTECRPLKIPFPTVDGGVAAPENLASIKQWGDYHIRHFTPRMEA